MGRLSQCEAAVAWENTNVARSGTVGTFGEGRGKIVYRVYGDGNFGTPLVLVHGLSGSQRWWRKNLKAFSSTRRVYTIDLIGYGDNRAFRPGTVESAASALDAFIALLPQGTADVVGHSMGGQISLTLAARFPERVHKLVLAAASGLVRSSVLRMFLRLPTAMRYSRLDFFPTLAIDALRAGPFNLIRSSGDLLRGDVTALLPKITAPTLLIWGRQDNLVPLITGEAMQKGIAGSQFQVIEHAGHVLMWDKPDIFNRTVLDFLNAPMDRYSSPK